MLSVICPIYNEAKYIDACIQSILLQDYPKDKLEILFVDGMSSDGTRDTVLEYSKLYSFIKLIDNYQKIVPIAMNAGIRVAVGNVIMRLDAHALYPPNYFSTLVRRLEELKADNVGTVCKTDVLNKNSKSLAIREVLCNRFGVGNSIFRLGVNEVMDVDTVPFGCWRRDVFERYGYYDVRLVRNQDIELNKRIIRGGGRICIIPDTYCTYLARETYRGIARNNYSNGKWNMLTLYYTSQFDSLSIRHFVPLLFVLSLVLPLFLSVFYLKISYIALLSLFLYLMLLGGVCLSLCFKNKLNIAKVLAAFIVLHMSYGWGGLVGVFDVLLKKGGLNKC